MTVAERALVDPASMVPYTALTLDTDCLLQGAQAAVSAQALLPMANPCFTMITDSSLYKEI